MFHFTINGKIAETADVKRLIYFLRDDLHLTSVKNGCAEGACGTCTIIINGRAKKCCVLTTEKADGAEITTLEGLTAREKDVYSYAFEKAGAVQCGFCIPGMIMSAKGLIDENPCPTIDDVKAAINGNICRCTGYKKIEEAILLAAELFRSGEAVPTSHFIGGVGEDMFRVDALPKALGTGKYSDDVYFEGMLYGSAVRTKYPRARILSIDTSKAAALPGVEAVVTRDDIPGAKIIGHLRQDWDVLYTVGQETRTIGDPIVLIAACDRDTLERAKALVEIEYEELKPVTCPAEALAEGAPTLHEGGNILTTERLKRGDADAKIAASKYVVTEHYSVPFTEHAFLEPETAVARPTDEGGMEIFSGDQGSYQTRKECSAMLGLSPDMYRYLTSIYEKTNTKSRIGLVIKFHDDKDPV